jgi:hypothetical protein
MKGAKHASALEIWNLQRLRRHFHAIRIHLKCFV